MENLNGCQIPSLPKMASGKADFGPQRIDIRLKRALARPWNYHVKKYFKRVLMIIRNLQSKIGQQGKVSMNNENIASETHLETGDWVMVRSLDEIQKTLNRFKELKGCAFLEDMKQYCGSQQRVLKVMERFLDERDYHVKKTKGIVLLEGVYCQGTPVFGRCDRSCLSFWREECLEKISV